MRPSTLDLVDKKVCKATLTSTATRALVREAIGTDPKFWSELVGVLKVGVVSLERRSFAVWDPTGVDYESTSGGLIAGHYPGLWKDLERVNDLLSIARNVLTIGPAAQNLAVEHSVEAEVFKLINCAVRVTARGYDGEAGVGQVGSMSEEERWQYIVNAYKKLLITSLQFLNNLVARNERQKLRLWMGLFECGNASENMVGEVDDDGLGYAREGGNFDIPSNPTREPVPPITGYDYMVAYGKTADGVPEHAPFNEPHGFLLFSKRNRDLCASECYQQLNAEPTIEEVRNAVFQRWDNLDKSVRSKWKRSSDDLWEKYYADVNVWQAKAALHMPAEEQQVDGTVPSSVSDQDAEVQAQDDSYSGRFRPINAEDLTMHFTADAGIRILESGKSELMKRLEGYEAPPHHLTQSMNGYGSDPNLSATRRLDAARMGRPRSLARARTTSRTPSPRATLEQPIARLNGQVIAGQGVERPANGIQYDHEDPASSEDEDHDEGGPEDHDLEDASDEEEEEDEDDPEAEGEGSNEDGRGLLTDVPLILGPSEIEVLPMLIMSGIVSPPPPHPNVHTSPNSQSGRPLIRTHTVRTHLLLSSPSGRNLLRELLIFVAAWDLREEELYFKFMVKILEAILSAGLMPFAYHAFRDRSRSRDIISPAQAVIMKLMTVIFRGRGGGKGEGGGRGDGGGGRGGGRCGRGWNEGAEEGGFANFAFRLHGVSPTYHPADVRFNLLTRANPPRQGYGVRFPP